MALDDFIFSNDRRYRVIRHLCFWLGWFLFSGIVQLRFNPTTDRNPFLHAGDIILYQFVRSLARLPSILLFCYLIVYFLVPKFIGKGKLKRFVLFLLMSVILLYVVTVGCAYLFQVQFQRSPYVGQNWATWVFFFNAFYSNINFTGAIPTCCLMLAIRYYKSWSVKQHRSAQLGRENVQAELQLLKAQVHPHFLFNTLNNIYSFVLNKDSRAAGLVDKLAGMIDYMRTDGEDALVLLVNEIRLLKDYVGLEKVRYGDRLDLKVEINIADNHKMIAPLLMIPFVENCFKHGASMMRGKQWISLSIMLRGNELGFLLRNSKPRNAAAPVNRKNIGLTNVRKRLQLLYPGKHLLQINTSPDVYEVHLLLVLEDSENLEPAEEGEKQQEKFYILNQAGL